MAATRGGLESFSSYEEAIAWLYGTQQFGIKLGLENMARLLKAMDLPGDKARIIHVAGTNGKGSVCAFADSLLQAAGRRVGLFTSPHLVHYSERMRINGMAAPESEIATRLNRIRELVNGWEQHPTFFELTLAVALDWFRDDGVEFIVLETGMGGRLDATNAVTASASVITPIALDHQKWLGTDLATIAGEKAGIMKPGIPVFSSLQQQEAGTVLEAKADHVGATLEFLSEHQLAEIEQIPLGLEGLHQRDNAALALSAVRATAGELDAETIRHGLTAVRWSARFERFFDGRVVIDGAHNVEAARATAATWQQAFGDEKAAIIFGSVEDKDHRAILAELVPIASAIHYVPFASARAIPPAKLAQECHPDPNIPFTADQSLQETIASAAASKDTRTLIVGSLFLAGETISLLRESSFETSDQ